MENAQLIISTDANSTSTVGRCSACNETFALSASAKTDPLLGQSELREVFAAHIRDKHSWRADANQTAALQLRKIMEDLEKES